MSDLPQPRVQPRDWVFIGMVTGDSAVVCSVDGHRVRVVYLGRGDQPIADWIVWRGDRWEFEHSGVTGIYADRHVELGEYVSRLVHGYRD